MKMTLAMRDGTPVFDVFVAIPDHTSEEAKNRRGP
jgi:hypothetical protein